MAKIAGKADKKVTLYMFGGLAALAGIGAIVMLNTSSKPSGPAQGAERAAKAGTLGSTSEGGTAYNQTFQERVLKTVNQGMEQMRVENAAKLEAFQHEQQAHDAERYSRLQETLSRVAEAQQAQQAHQDDRSSQVEKMSFFDSTGANRKQNSDTGLFSGSPSDVKSDVATEIGDAAAALGVKKEVAGLNVPPNGFIRARTLNGIVAVVGEPAKGFLAKMQGRYRAANGFVVNLDGCTTYIEGRADLSAGRVMGKPVSMTCDFEEGTSKTWQVSGYVVDKDGIEGIVGVINDNSGKKLAGASLAGGIALAGSALSRAQTDSFTSSVGTSQVVTGSVGADVAGGVVQGAGTELGKQVIEHYNQYAASVQVGGNRDITIVLLNELAVPDAGKAITVTHGVGTKGTP
jgi:hypothetical protein